MGYYIGINTGDLEDTVEDYIIKNSLDGDPDDLWSQNGWGFFEELSTITYDNEALFSDLELEKKLLYPLKTLISLNLLIYAMYMELFFLMKNTKK